MLSGLFCISNCRITYNEIIHQSLHDDGTPILLLHSDEWAQKGFGSIPIIRDMYEQFGQMEFSDTCC
jgi:hypothetical protein